MDLQHTRNTALFRVVDALWGHHFHIQNRLMTSTKPLYIRGFSRNFDPTLSSLIRLRTPRLGVRLGVR